MSGCSNYLKEENLKIYFFMILIELSALQNKSLAYDIGNNKKIYVTVLSYLFLAGFLMKDANVYLKFWLNGLYNCKYSM